MNPSSFLSLYRRFYGLLPPIRGCVNPTALPLKFFEIDSWTLTLVSIELLFKWNQTWTFCLIECVSEYILESNSVSQSAYPVHCRVYLKHTPQFLRCDGLETRLLLLYRNFHAYSFSYFSFVTGEFRKIPTVVEITRFSGKSGSISVGPFHFIYFYSIFLWKAQSRIYVE